MVLPVQPHFPWPVLSSVSGMDEHMFTSQERRFFDGVTSHVTGFVGTVLKAVTDVAERALNAVENG